MPDSHADCWPFSDTTSRPMARVSSRHGHVRKPLDRFRGRRHDDRMDLAPDACFRALRTRDARFDGRIFVGVKTTGIYCRPVCPARTPKRENVAFYRRPPRRRPQASGRVCGAGPRPRRSWLPGAGRRTRSRARCRSSRWAHWTMGRGDARGASWRRRPSTPALFERHLGASPIAVAQTRRVLLAKQLIHETNLPMSDVALAAGFGSIRRFNETCQRLFRCSPSALRAGGAVDIPRGSNGEVSLLLRYRPPYDWPSILDFLQTRAIPALRR